MKLLKERIFSKKVRGTLSQNRLSTDQATHLQQNINYTLGHINSPKRAFKASRKALF